MIRPRHVAAAILFVTSCASSAVAADVSIRTDDGVTLAAVWSPAPQPAGAVLLLHSYLRSHSDWDAVASRLHDAGLSVLQLDLRGHGLSGGVGTDQFAMFPRDVRAALAWMKTQPDVLPGKIGIAGLNLGATLAVIGAGAEPARAIHRGHLARDGVPRPQVRRRDARVRRAFRRRAPGGRLARSIRRAIRATARGHRTGTARSPPSRRHRGQWTGAAAGAARSGRCAGGLVPKDAVMIRGWHPE